MIVPKSFGKGFSLRKSKLGLRLTALVVVAFLAAVLGGSALAARDSASVTVKMSEFKFVLSAASAHPGAVVFTVTNKGKLPHDFKIGGKKTALVSPGKTAKLSVTLKAGKYPYLCTVAGHAAAGMKGTFTVK
ncbi:MAG: blue (type 1) copper domain protein [Actinomycetia bacterium]|nr:blue (type 1) copper domain protein [Actinomycetes bacterium]